MNFNTETDRVSAEFNHIEGGGLGSVPRRLTKTQRWAVLLIGIALIYKFVVKGK